jgi:hypothetical protein
VFNETYWIAIQFRGVCENVLKDWFVIVFFPAAEGQPRRCRSAAVFPPRASATHVRPRRLAKRPQHRTAYGGARSVALRRRQTQSLDQNEAPLCQAGKARRPAGAWSKSLRPLLRPGHRSPLLLFFQVVATAQA